MRFAFALAAVLFYFPTFAAELGNGPISLRQVSKIDEVKGTWNQVGDGCLIRETKTLRSYQKGSQQDELQRMTIDAKEVQYLVMSSNNLCNEHVINKGDIHLRKTSPTLELATDLTVTGTSVVKGCVVSDGAKMKISVGLEFYFSNGILATVLHSPLLAFKCADVPGGVSVTFWESREMF